MRARQVAGGPAGRETSADGARGRDQHTELLEELQRIEHQFRPLIADSLVLTIRNDGEVRSAHFARALGSGSLTATGRRTFIEAYERRMCQDITHPVFGYRISYRRVLEVRARLLARYLNGEIPQYPPFTTR